VLGDVPIGRAPGASTWRPATYTHRDAMCSLKVLIGDDKLGGDPAFAPVAKVVEGAGVSRDTDSIPRNRGLDAEARDVMTRAPSDQAG